MSWKVHSHYFSWQIERQYNDATGRPMMSYRATFGGWKETPHMEVTAKNLDGIKEAVKKAIEEEKQ